MPRGFKVKNIRCLPPLLLALIASALIAAGCASGDKNPAAAGAGGGENSAGVSPQANPDGDSQPQSSGIEAGEHWHASYAFYMCGELLPILQNTNSPGGIHSHADGVIHIHPSTAEYAGENATLGAFGEAVGFRFTEDQTSIAIGLNGKLEIFSEESSCPDYAQSPTLKVVRWNLKSFENTEETPEPEIFTENFSDIFFENNLEAYTIALVPDGSRVPLPPSSRQIADIEPQFQLPNAEELGLVPERAAPPLAGKTLSGPTPCPDTEAGVERTTQFAQAPPSCINGGTTYTAVFHTTQGDISVEMRSAPSETPVTSNIFIALARYGYYDGTALFRIDPFQGIIQGGSPHTNNVEDQGPGFVIPDEGSGYVYRPGRLVMARGAGANSATGQFMFTITEDVDKRLRVNNANFVVFGEVTEGMDVLEKIYSLYIESYPPDDPQSRLLGGPLFAVIVESVEIIES